MVARLPQLPAPAPLTMPAPSPITMPTAESEAGFGIDPADVSFASSSPYLQPLLGTPTPYAGPSAMSLAYGGQMAGMSALTGGAITAENDPRKWTPETAQTQSDQALAKIATLNPQLAQEIANQQGLLKDPQEEDRGFWGDLMGGLGTILEVTHLDDVFELLSRPAKILPEMIMDWGEESVWKNMGDALSGNSDVSWDDVLVEKLGWERNFFTAALGFIGDVALDPLTYIPLGRLASLGRETTSMVAGKAVVRGSYDEAAEIVAKASDETADISMYTSKQIEEATYITETFDIAARQTIDTMDEAAGFGALTAKEQDQVSAAIFGTSDVAKQMSLKAQKGIRGRMESAMRGVDPDAVPGVINVAADTMASRGLRILQARADDAVKIAYRGDFSKAAKLLGDQMSWPQAYAEKVLKRWMSEGNALTPGFGRAAKASKGTYMRAREAATQLGGYRFHLNIPILGMRIAPKRLLPKGVPMLNFSHGRRFFAGMSGEMRLQRMVGKKVATHADYETFVTKGFSGLMNANREVAKKLAGGRFSKFGSPLMSASEQMGRLTAHFSPHAAMMRMGGLGGIRTAQAARQAPALEEAVVAEMQRHVMADGETILRGEALQRFQTEAFDPVYKAAKAGDDAALSDLGGKLDRWAALFGPEAGNGSVDEMVKRLPGGSLSPEELAEAKELEAYFRGVSDNAYEAAQSARMTGFATDEVGMVHGIAPTVDRFGFDDMDDMTPADARVAASQTQHGYNQDSVWDTADPDAVKADMFDEDVLADVSTSGASARAVRLVKRKDTGIGQGAEDRQKLLTSATRRQRRAERELREMQRGDDGLVEVDPKKFLSAEKRLQKANAELNALTVRGSGGVVAYGKNGFTIDLRKGGNESTMGVTGNLAKEVEAKVRQVSDLMNKGADQIDDAAIGAMAPELRAIARMLREGGNVPAAVTASLMRDGYDHIRILTDDAEELLMFRNPTTGHIPMARITDGAVPAAPRFKGNAVRGATEEAYQAIRKSKVKDLPGASKTWLEGELRRVAHLPLDEAEAELQAAFAQLGVSFGGRILERDYFKSLAIAQRAKARQVKASVLGRAARQLESLGLTSSISNGKLVGLDKYRFVIENESVMNAISYYAAGVKEAAEGTRAFQIENVKALKAIAEAASDDFKYHWSAYEDAIGALDGGTYRKVLAGRRVDGAPPEAQAVLNEARAQSRAQDLGDGYWLVEDPETGTRTFLSTKSVGQEGADGIDVEPYGTRPVPDGFVRVAHESPRSRVKSIRNRGVDPAREAESLVPGGGAFAYADDARVLKRLEGAEVSGTPQTHQVVEAFVPADRVVIDETGEAIVKGGIKPEEIVGVHTPGREVVTGFREVDVNGRVTMVFDDSQGIREGLLWQHWNADGVLDDPEPIVAAAQQLIRQGVAGSGERKLTASLDQEVQRLGKHADETKRAYEAANTDYLDAVKEVQRLETKLRTEAAKVTPALVPATKESLSMAGFERLDDIPGFGDTAMPTVMAQEFRKAIEGFGGLDGVHKEFRRFNSWWKSWATYMTPSFHIRNMYGAFFNNMLGGVNIGDYVLASRIRRAARSMNNTGTPGKWGKKTLIDGGDGDLIDAFKREGQTTVFGKPVDELTYGDLGAMTSAEGVTAGNSAMFGEAQVLTAPAERRAGDRLTERLPGLKQYTNVAKGTGEMTENVMRTAAYVRGIKTYGTPTEARAFTMMRHGDYADLTDFEYGVVRDLVPFYKWMRTNTPFQIHQLLENPGKLLAVAKAQDAVFTAQGMDYDEKRHEMPKWMGESFIVPLGGEDENGNYDTISLDLPMSDLHKSAGDYVSSFLPLAMPAIESYVVDQDLFTGAPISGEKVPLAGIFQVPGLRELMKVTGLAEEGAGGKLYTTDQKKNLLGMLPMFSRYQDWLFSEPGREGSRVRSLISAATGVRPRPVDQAAMVAAELDFYYSELVPAMDRLRGLGYPLPSVADMEATYGDVASVLVAQGITPKAETLEVTPATLPTFGAPPA